MDSIRQFGGEDAVDHPLPFQSGFAFECGSDDDDLKVGFSFGP
jgi:hypothetical protein